MNQKELIEAVRLQGAYNNGQMAPSVTKKTAEAWLSAVCEIIGAALIEGGEVTLPGVGKLKTDTRAARAGRNPATGETIQIPAKTVIKFVPAKLLKDALA